MIEILFILIPACYGLFTIKTKFTPICSSIVWINKNASKLKKKLFKKKVQQSVVQEFNPFVPAPPSKPLTQGEKVINKTGDVIAQSVVQSGSFLLGIDNRIKIFGGIVLSIVFSIGIYYSFVIIIHHWKLFFITVALFSEWVTWLKANKSSKENEIKIPLNIF